MKSSLKNLCLSGYLIILVSSACIAQCGTLQSVTYDTLVAGTGNNTHVFSLSKFDPAVGTLVSARINSVISVNYGFTLQNVESVQRNFSVSVGRYDNFSSAALSTPYTNLTTIPLGSFLLDPGNTVTHASSTILSNYLQTDSLVYDMSNFLGSGSVDFNYTPITYTNLAGSNIYYYSATASDVIDFSITYFYCTATILPTSIINFLAQKNGAETVQLSWTTLNELDGRNYEIQESENGNTFTTVSSMPSLVSDNNTGDYLYDYHISPTDKNLVYFRIKMTDVSGAINYSPTREVDLNNNSGNLYLYPNPSANFINVVFNQPGINNWHVNIYAANGSLVQSNDFQNSSSAYIAFKQKLAAGTYFMRAINGQTQKNYIQSFLVQ